MKQRETSHPDIESTQTAKKLGLDAQCFENKYVYHAEVVVQSGENTGAFA